MKLIYAVPFLLIIDFIIMGCSNPVYVQKDESANLAKYKTYMWVDTRASQDDIRKRSIAFADISMHNAVNAELSKRGWKEVNENPDILLSYDILVQRSTATQTDPVYTHPFTRFYYNPWARRWGTIYYPSQFMGYDVYEAPVREGTVTVSMMDANSDKTIWQGWTTEDLQNRRITDPEINKAVRHIFKKFNKS